MSTISCSSSLLTASTMGVYTLADTAQETREESSSWCTSQPWRTHALVSTRQLDTTWLGVGEERISSNPATRGCYMLRVHA